MRAILCLDRRATYAEYLAAEHGSEVRHEYIDGVVVAMAGGSDEHNAISSRFGGLCMLRLSGDCRHYTADQRFWIAATGRGRYSNGVDHLRPPRAPAARRASDYEPRGRRRGVVAEQRGR